ncbi:MAG TPA: maleylpyruvate isomerase family mycothiol-dependent enzyme [Pseudonocardiaceae bacterium]|nr:maleylpyruvate isomerase family mycothiol-dependent enzyme [Pseudonocardiaceae bacterium]
MNGYFEVYREARGRIVDVVRGCSAEQLARKVPGCPKWSVADTVAHLAAAAADVAAGTLTTVPDEEHTAAQVAQRRGRTLDEVIAEWDEACGELADWGSSAGPVEQAVPARRLPAAMVHDVLTHEADIRGALGAGRPPDAAWEASLSIMLRHPERLKHLPHLTVRAGAHEFTVGSGEPAATLAVDPYEFWRAQVGRRSRAQMAGWQWSGDPAPYLRAIPVFGPTDTDLTEPVTPVRSPGTGG